MYKLKLYRTDVFPDTIPVLDSEVEVNLQYLLNKAACSIPKIVKDDNILSVSY